MFESILVGPSVNVTNPAEPGTIAEALLFYENVHWVTNFGGIQRIAQRVGLDEFDVLVGEARISIICHQDLLAVTNFP